MTLTKIRKWDGDADIAEVSFMTISDGRVERRVELHMGGKVQHSVPKVSALRGTFADFIARCTSAGWSVVAD